MLHDLLTIPKLYIVWITIEKAQNLIRDWVFSDTVEAWREHFQFQKENSWQLSLGRIQKVRTWRRAIYKK